MTYHSPMDKEETVMVQKYSGKTTSLKEDVRLSGHTYSKIMD